MRMDEIYLAWGTSTEHVPEIDVNRASAILRPVSMSRVGSSRPKAYTLFGDLGSGLHTLRIYTCKKYEIDTRLAEIRIWYLLLPKDSRVT